MQIKGPTLFINPETAKKNILKMLTKARKHQAHLRPHFKTHQSAERAEWFKEEGVTKCAVSSVQMAQYFANAGWNDITIAFPFNILEIEAVNKLAEKIDLNLCIESKEVASFLLKNINSKVGVFLKIDAGYHRTGLDASNYDLIEEILKVITNGNKLSFKGFLQHAGHTYQAKSKAEVEEIHQYTSSQMRKLKAHFINEYPDLIISNGDTPTCSICQDFEEVDEIRPGNFVFYDVMQANIGSCSYEDIAVALACPVVAKHPERNEIIIYGGAIHFSKDSIIDATEQKIFGLVASNEKQNKWGTPIDGVYLKKLSQEHGTIHAPQQFIDEVKIGDILYCLPIHSCLTTNLMSAYLTTEGKHISMFRYNAGI
jgi:D-serine deaminase-like pyridoxal phosphate-dependent protein